MTKSSLTANSLGTELHIHTEGSEDDLQSFIDHDFWYRFVPGVELETTASRHNPDLSISIDPEESWSFDPAAHELACPPSNILHAICTAGYMLDAKRQASGLYTLHGNVIANKNNTIALVGPISGIGKTGLSSRAVDRGWRWIADDKFVINDEGEYIGSTKGVLQDDKTRLSARNNEPDTAQSYSKKIGAFIIPIVTDSTSIVSHTYDHTKAFWHLHEEMSRDVRMTPFALDGPNIPLPSFDSDDIATRRHKVAAELTRLIPYLFVTGHEELLLDYLSEPIR